MEIVRICEFPAQFMSEEFADRGFAGTHNAHQDENHSLLLRCEHINPKHRLEGRKDEVSIRAQPVVACRVVRFSPWPSPYKKLFRLLIRPSRWGRLQPFLAPGTPMHESPKSSRKLYSAVPGK